MECDILQLEIPDNKSSFQSNMPGSSSLPPKPRRSPLAAEQPHGRLATPLRQSYSAMESEGHVLGGCDRGLATPVLSTGNLAEHPKGLVQPLPPQRTHSMPSSPKFAIQNSGLISPTLHKELLLKQIAQAVPKVCRSISLPALRDIRSTCHQSSLQRQEVLVMQPVRPNDPMPISEDLSCNDFGQDEEELPKEKAICRICMLELDEGGETLKMECSCKGELALAHKDCAVKWFSIKGNGLCDICSRQVRNLPVILFRRPSALHWVDEPEIHEQDSEENSSWHHAAVIILSSALASLWHKLEELAEFP